MIYQALASGSNGNCAVLTTDDGALLIDAGISRKRIIDGLKKLDISPSHVKGILITHAHSDHISGLPILSKYLKAPVISTPGTIAEIALLHGRNPIYEEIARNALELQLYMTTELSKFSISSYPALHDISGACGFSIEFNDFKLSYATDTGGLEDGFRKAMKDSDMIVLESNHDEDMLMTSRRSHWLKNRIRNTHLSNRETRGILEEVITDRTKLVMMAHISGECNTPKHVMQSIQGLLSQNEYGWDWAICTRFDKSTLITQKKEKLVLSGGLSSNSKPKELLDISPPIKDDLRVYF